MRKRQVAQVIGLVLALAGALLADRTWQGGERRAGAGSGEFLSAGWYCALPAGTDMDSHISTTNLGKSVIRVRSRVFTKEKESAASASELRPRLLRTTRLSEFGLDEGSVLVEAFGGRSVTHAVSLSPFWGASVSACTTQPSDRWVFAAGSSLRGHDTLLLVGNPFEEEALIDVRVMTSGRELAPSRLQGFVIPPLSQARVLLAEFVPELPLFGMEVRASRGRVVVGRELRSVAGELHWFSSQLGVHSPTPSWHSAGGEVPREGAERLMILNPGDREALVSITMPTRREVIVPEALRGVAIPAGRLMVVDLGRHVRAGVHHGVSLVSVNGVPVVAERATTGTIGAGRGADSVFGADKPADQWILPAGGPAGSTRVTLMSPGTHGSVVKLSIITAAGVGQPEDLAAVRLAPGTIFPVDVNRHLRGHAGLIVAEALAGEFVLEGRVMFGAPYGDFAFISAVAGQ